MVVDAESQHILRGGQVLPLNRASQAIHRRVDESFVAEELSQPLATVIAVDVEVAAQVRFGKPVQNSGGAAILSQALLVLTEELAPVGKRLLLLPATNECELAILAFHLGQRAVEIGGTQAVEYPD